MNTPNDKRTQPNAPLDTQAKTAPGAHKQPSAQQQTQRPGETQQKQAPKPQDPQHKA